MARKPARKRRLVKTGRPSAFTPKVLEQVRKMASMGWIEGEIVDVLGVNPSTFWRWKNQHPRLLKALSIGAEAANSRVELACYHLAIGFERDEEEVKFVNGVETRYRVRRFYPPNPAAIAMWTRTKMAWGQDIAPPPTVTEAIEDDRPVDVRVVARQVARLIHLSNKETEQ